MKKQNSRNPLTLTWWSSDERALQKPQGAAGCTPLRVKLLTPKSKTELEMPPVGCCWKRKTLPPGWGRGISGVPRRAAVCLREVPMF